MWIVRWIVLVVIIVAVLGFSLQNQGQIDGVRLLNWDSGPIPLYVALFIAYALGMVSFLLIAVFQQLQTLSDLGRARKAKKKVEAEREELRKELDSVRDEIEHHESEKVRLREEVESLKAELNEERRTVSPYAPAPDDREEVAEGEDIVDGEAEEQK